MGVLTSLFAGVAGIHSAGQQISVVGDNIANVNTPGFKTSRAEFQDVLAGNLSGVVSSGQIGAGSRVSGVSQTFTQGSLESTGVTTDLAIDGAGFFTVQDATGVYYTRAGLFRLDNQQQLINDQGQSVLGFGVTPQGVPNGALGTINLSSASSLPNPTATVGVNVNLDPNDAAIPAATVFDHTDPVTTSNFQTGIRVFDSLGNPQNLLVYFRKDDAVANTWTWVAGANRGDLDMTSFGAGFAQGPASAQSQFVPVQSGTLTFDATGVLQLESTTALTLTYDTDGDGTIDTAAATPQTWNWSSGANAQTMVFDFGTSVAEGGTGADDTTQFGGASASGVNSFVRFMNQDGFSAGTLQALNIDEDGFVTGSFSNGQTDRLAQVALATFPAVEGLVRAGRNNFLESASSGQAVVGSPNQGGFGAIRSGFLEQSNTDLADQFVKLIIAQRAFQANTRTVSTTNELLASLVNLGQ